MPTMNHAGVYSETLAFLKAAAAEGTLSGRKIVARMEAAPIDDALFGPTTIRPDGRAVHAMYLFRVKKARRVEGTLRPVRCHGRPSLPAKRSGRWRMAVVPLLAK